MSDKKNTSISEETEAQQETAKSTEDNFADQTSRSLGNENQFEEGKESLYAQMNMNAEHQYVTFSLGEEEYGVKILAVQEIVSIPEVTHIPNTPNYIKGVINLRGNVIPLLDLRIKFNLEEKEINKYSVVLVIRVSVDNKNEKTVGMIVDTVSDVLSFSDENLQEVPNFSSNIDSNFIDKIGKLGKRLIILLDISKILTNEELNQIKKINS